LKKIIPFILLLLLAAACNPFASIPTGTTSETVNIVSFEASPSSIETGQSATLIWNVTGATEIKIDQGIGTVDVAGTTPISPTTSTTYTITASNEDSWASQSFTVSVTQASEESGPTPPQLPPLIALFDISPTTIHIPPGPGPYKAIMKWDVKNADTVLLDGNPVGHSGTRELTPPVGTHTYVLKAVSSVGTDTQSRVLHVTP
jgi:hypothetical protein